MLCTKPWKENYAVATVEMIVLWFIIIYLILSSDVL